MAHSPKHAKDLQGKEKASYTEPLGFRQMRYDDWYGDYDDLQAITANIAFEHLSFEELRLIDYTKGGGQIDWPRHIRSQKLELAPVPKPCTRCRYVFVSERSICFAEPNFRSRVILFHVGNPSNPTEFTVYETFVPSRSTYIRKLLKDWKENHEPVVKLPRVEFAVFQMYHQWILTGCIFSYNLAEMLKKTTEYDLLARGYFLGEQLNDINFKDTLIDCIIHKLHRTGYFDLYLTQVIWQNTRANCNLRRLWLHIYLWSGNRNWLDEQSLGTKVHRGFRSDLEKERKRREMVETAPHPLNITDERMRLERVEMEPHPPYTGDTCRYHEHGKGSCYRMSDGL